MLERFRKVSFSFSFVSFLKFFIAVEELFNIQSRDHGTYILGLSLPL